MKHLLSVAALAPFSTSTFATPLSPGNMPAYCRGQASSEFGTKPFYIKTGKLVRAKNGSYSVKGTTDLGDQGKKPFQCNYDKKSLIIFLIIGAVAGWLAGLLMKGRGFGLLGNIIVGIIGAILGGFLFGVLGIVAGGLIGSIVTATVGAVVLLFLISIIKKP